jgi:hypothetical protein
MRQVLQLLILSLLLFLYEHKRLVKANVYLQKPFHATYKYWSLHRMNFLTTLECPEMDNDCLFACV